MRRVAVAEQSVAQQIDIPRLLQGAPVMIKLLENIWDTIGIPRPASTTGDECGSSHKIERMRVARAPPTTVREAVVFPYSRTLGRDRRAADVEIKD
jgi:hypothetical protein